ncbi:MAG: hypothetical protein IT288_13105 [Bdellovibrionales bacterium]|nr:hypothetical protein [Bdellovibrionales bacterium]
MISHRICYHLLPFKSLLALALVTGSSVLAGTINSQPTTIAVRSPSSLTPLAQAAAAMSPGQWLQLETTNFSGMLLPNFSGNGSSPFIEFSDKAVRNPLTKKIYILGCARGAQDPAYECGSTGSPDAGYVEYSEIDNTWRRMPSAPVNSAPHAYDHAAINPLNGDYYYYESSHITDHKVWKHSNNQWTSLPAPSGVYSQASSLDFFPELNSLVYIEGGNGFPGKVFTLKVGATSWTSIPVGGPIGTISTFAQYSAKRKLIYFGGGVENERKLYTLDAQGTITARSDAPTSLGVGGSWGRQSIDPTTGNLLVFDNGSALGGTSKVYEYNPDHEGAGPWTSSTTTHPLADTYGNLIAVFTPIVEVGVIFVASWSGGSPKVYLYKPQ